MKCPVCNDVRMREVEKDGVLIDVCPDCKGVWLDRGELEKLMSEIREIRPAFNEWYDRHDDGHAYEQREKDYRNPDPRIQQQGYKQGYPQGHYKHKKKKSVLDVFGDLFD
ncbi:MULTISPECIES: TFIIB-type zinc ribbon-containing protein [Paenibacillus]|uniref:Transcription factor zinc-finger domain-containing protein n=1 Tax=Paenibacillus vini TaxID=1476024 RepID=A0ABQ4MIG4_9BACL|nr:zf-TFIIB domain-containing protein [Paenibacillus vini]MDN4069228.1 zf-TFIIB domain-containing protein [Paenibacillus vini]GIP55785.1 hypothetical protein J42TS3_48200 [Paenibacillus vini]